MNQSSMPENQFQLNQVVNSNDNISATMPPDEVQLNNETAALRIQAG